MTIKEAHEKGLFSVVQLAQACGVSRSTVYAWINGKEPGASNVQPINEVIGHSVITRWKR